MLFTAALLEEQNRPLVLRKLEMPAQLSVGQVQVDIYCSGICGAQLGEISGVKGRDKYVPHTLGHEGSGIVRACGPGVKTVKPRDRVIIHWRKGIGIESEPPQYWCPDLGQYVGSGWNTTFQECSIVSENRLTKIDDSIPFHVAALFGCAVTTGLGLVSNEARVKIGESVAVLGCGGVGLNVIQGCSLASAYPIIGIDIKEEKLRQALVMGATHVFQGPAALEDIKKICPKGVDVFVDTTGQAAVMEFGFKALAATGRLHLVGQLRFDQTMALQTLDMHHGKQLSASDGGATEPSVDIPRYLKLYKSGRLNLESLITHKFSLRDINKALDLIRVGQCGRAIIEMHRGFSA